MLMKKFAAVIGILVFQNTTHAQQLFNSNWQFHKGDIVNGEINSSDTIKWRTLNLPHDWSIEGPFSKEWASATGFLPGGIGWYKKTFTTPADWSSKKIFIYFDGVYKNSTVWLNGHLLGNRPNGFIAFEYELTRYLNPKGTNIITVKVDHTEFADSRWYTGSGIYRNVYLFSKAPVHIAKWGVQFSTPVVTKNSASARVSVNIINQQNKDVATTVTGVLRNSKGKIVAQNSSKIAIKKSDSAVVLFSLTVPRPELWSVDNPALYTLAVSLVANGKRLDQYAEKIGIRTLGFDADKGFSLNGKITKLKGVCIHDDAGALGVAVPEAVWRRRLELLKAGGSNSIRMSHNPHADYIYRLCDELGLLVIEEAFDEWETGKNKWIEGWNVGKPGKDGYHQYFKEWADIDVRDMIRRTYNHPSIIAWSIGNEIDYPNDPYSSEVLNTGNNPQIYGKGYLPDHPAASRLGELSKQLADVVRKVDTTRPVTAALAGVVMSNETTYPDNIDWVGYNYQEYRYADDHAKYPKRIIYGSENGMQLKAWNAVDSNDYISAQYLWTGVDYLGEAGRWPVRSNRAGLIDLAGFPKPEYYFRQSLWTEKPMIYAGATPVPKQEDRGIWSHRRSAPTWNWKVGDKLRVNCFTNCTEAELFLNGTSLGKKAMADFKERIIYWDIDYTAGELKAVGYSKGIASASYKLETSGKAHALKATIEKDSVGKTGLVHVVITVVDTTGNIVYDAENEATVSIAGRATLLGLESGSDNSHEDYKANKRKALHGKLVAYVMMEPDTKPVIITINSAGLSPVTLTLK